MITDIIVESADIVTDNANSALNKLPKKENGGEGIGV